MLIEEEEKVKLYDEFDVKGFGARNTTTTKIWFLLQDKIEAEEIYWSGIWPQCYNGATKTETKEKNIKYIKTDNDINVMYSNANVIIVYNKNWSTGNKRKQRHDHNRE